MDELSWGASSDARNPIKSSLAFVGEVASLFLSTVRSVLTGKIEFKETIRQMAFIGVASIPIVAITAAFSGAVLALYSATLLVKYGVGSLAGGAVGLSVAREIAPVLTSIMVSARCGSAIAAHIASMKVTEQIDALRALAVSPISYLVVPRTLAALIMVPALCTVANFSGIFGGAIVAGAIGVSYYSYFESLRATMETFDITGGLIKAAVFALIVALVGCQQGLGASGGAAGVGRATTRAVVISLSLIYIVNYFLADALFNR
ncbi:MAG: ABC transporter permease [Armatimonadetes bacterium]|nr:ABC transporter permease [Armatimonadota bacterium]